MRSRTVSLVKHPDPRRSKRWQVCYRDIHNKRRSSFFVNRAEAQVYAEMRRTEITNFGLKSLSLADSVRHQAQQALDVLAPHGKTILDAVEFYVGHLERTAQSCSVEQLLENFLWAKEGEKISTRHLSDLKSRLGRFSKAFEGRTANSIEPGEIADWIRSRAVSAQTQQNHRRVLHNFFNYALLMKFVSENPVKAIPAIRVTDAEVEIYSPTEMSLILEKADPLIIAYLALGAFAGLRGAELERLQWQNLDFQTGHIRIGGEIAKTRSKRLIPISNNLRAWLMTSARLDGNILPVAMRNTFRNLLHSACKKAGVKWKHNGLRHSFGTYQLAFSGDAARTALEMGNSPGIIFKHYRELVTKEQSSAYWNIRPNNESNIIPMRIAAI